MSSEGQLIAEAVRFIKEKCDLEPKVAIATGTGLGTLANKAEIETSIAYNEIPNFPVPKVSGHAGQLLLGYLSSVPVAILNGRCHLYEGWSAAEVVRPLRTLASIGVSDLLITNNAGALNPEFVTPAKMLIIDQINMTGTDPGVGPQEDELGLRFPDMTNCYDQSLHQAVFDLSKQVELPMYEGIYCGLRGPSLESPAERRFLRQIGGDAVGMSTVLETIAARALGLRVVGISALANMATGGPEQQPDTIEKIVAGARKVAVEINRLIPQLVATMASFRS